MSETNLKKEFTKRDVQRMRNIITKNFGDRTQVQSGWERHKKEYEEGDTWEENGKQWTIKNGIRQTVTKLDAIKKMTMLPLLCPTCEKPMKVNEFNKHAYSVKHMCFDCAIKEEDNLRISGEYEKEVNRRQREDGLVAIQDLESALEAWYNSEDNLVNEQGDIENWSGGDKTKMYEQVKEEIRKFKNT